MKNIILKLSFLAVFVLLFTACEKDDFTGQSKVNYVKPTATYSSTAGTNITVAETSIDPENGKTYTIKATLSAASVVDIYIDLTKVSGTLSAAEFETHDIYIPAGSLTGNGTITIFRTGDVEGTETLALKANTMSANVTGSATFNFTVNGDYVNDVLSFEMAWSGTYTYNIAGGTATVDFKVMDFDMLLFDSSFNLLDFYDGATGAQPEYVDFYGLPNGSYYLVADLYANPIAAANLNRPVKLRFAWEQEYFSHGSFTFTGFNSNNTSGTEIVATITVANGYVYTITPAQ